ncbi:MAG: (Fe-S)-binding protein [Phycisphaera sp. TMED9]|jgi:L-lactate dehydrogenase complex protein LldE|nr:MAG: (Fe-S)-binding protein [Phycisphaera sp. TMED9]
MRIALFVTCLMDQFRPDAAEATVSVLEQCGCEVVFDPRQTCCGQPAFNAGLHQDAIPVCKGTVRILHDQLTRGGCDAIVTPSGSCAAMFRHAIELLDGEDAIAAKRVSEATFELSDFLVRRLDRVELGASWPGRVAWHDACHGLRELGIKSGPRRLLEAVDGLELVESTTCERCCGFGGTFSVSLPGVSVGMADDKIDELETLGIDAVVSGDASCLMQLEGRLEARGSRIRGVHLAEILAAREAPMSVKS